MFKSIIFSKVFKHEPNHDKGKGYHGETMAPVERTWLVCDQEIGLSGFSPIRKYKRLMALEENLQGSQNPVG